jgi:hypothetical protein
MTLKIATLKETDAYVTSIKTKTTAWEPPRAPDCSSLTWQREWDTGSDDVRSNLAYAWLWHFDQLQAVGPRAVEHNNFLMGRQIRLIEAIYHHMMTVLPGAAQEKPCKELFTKSFFNPDRDNFEKHTDNPVLVMWFGNEQQKRDALVRAGRAQGLRSMGRFSELAQDIAWGIIRGSETELSHRLAAVNISILSGEDDRAPSAFDEDGQHWWVMGRALSISKTSFTKPADLERIAALKKFVIKQSDTWVAPLLAQLYKDHCFRATCLCDPTRMDPIQDEEKAVLGYTFLRHWLPDQEHALDMYEQLGMGYLEAGAAMGAQAEAHGVIALPHDISSPP